MRFTLLILFVLLSSFNPKKVITGIWKGGGFVLKITHIQNMKVFGSLNNGKEQLLIEGTYKEVIWDQPCSKAYGVKFKTEKGFVNAVFVGVENQTEGDDGITCCGKLHGVEAQVKTKQGLIFLYPK